MNRRNALKTIVVSSAVAAELLISGQPVHGYYYFYRYKFTYHVRRYRRCCRWRQYYHRRPF